MKKLIIAAVICLSLAACGNRANGPVTSEIDEWPDNKFTKTLPEPENGLPDEMTIDEGMGYCSVIYDEISREESEEYVEALKAAGFVELDGINDVSALGVPLQKDEVYVNVAASNDTLGINISIDD